MLPRCTDRGYFEAAVGLEAELVLDCEIFFAAQPALSATT